MKDKKTKVGEKYIIEIGSEYGSSTGDEPKKLYRAKGFNSLVFDERGLNMMEKAPESDLEAYRDAIIRVNMMSSGLRMRFFGKESVLWIIENTPPKEVIRIVSKLGTGIEVGDKCTTPEGTLIVLKVDESTGTVWGAINDIGSIRFDVFDMSYIERTGEKADPGLFNALNELNHVAPKVW